MKNEAEPGKSSDTLPRTLPPLGPFRLQREIGRGGMGVVYEAFDTRTRRDVALKLLNGPAELDPREARPAEDRFLREGRLLAAIPPHPGIVGVLETGTLEGRCFIAMELVRGMPLSEWRRQSSLTLQKHVAMIRDAALAAHHAHEHGVVHRDLKPDNILVERDSRVRLTDFGLAKLMEAGPGAPAGASGAALGTPHYMSPEQIQGRKGVDRRADVYALGVMLYEVLAGRKPFDGGSAFDIMTRTVREEVPTPSRVSRVHFNPILFKRLESICLTALARDPDDRYPTARDFAEDLTKWLRGDDFQVVLPRILRAARLKMILRRTALISAAALLGIAAALFMNGKRTAAIPPALRPGAIAEIYSGTNFNALGVRRMDTRGAFENSASPLWAEGPRFWASYRWRGQLVVPEGGTHLFEVTSKEGVRFLIDGAPVVVNWGYHPPTTDSKEVALAAGLHAIVLEYYHTSEDQTLRIRWKRPGSAAAAPLTPGQMLHDPATGVLREPPLPGENGSTAVAGAQPGETLAVVDSSNDAPIVKRYESHRLFWRGTWNGDSHLWWGAHVKPGDALKLRFDSPGAGKQTLVLAMTRGSDHGIFKVRVNGVEIARSLDLFDPDLKTGEIEFKDVELKAGSNEIAFEAAGSHPQAREWGPGTGLHKLGLNYLLVR